MEKNTQNIESLVIEGRPWSRRLADLALMNHDEINVSMVSLKAAGSIVSRLEDKGWGRPSIFANPVYESSSEDGVNLEWVQIDPFQHLTVEVSADGKTFDLHSMLNSKSENSIFETFADEDALFEFIETTESSPTKRTS